MKELLSANPEYLDSVFLERTSVSLRELLHKRLNPVRQLGGGIEHTVPPAVSSNPQVVDDIYAEDHLAHCTLHCQCLSISLRLTRASHSPT